MIMTTVVFWVAFVSSFSINSFKKRNTLISNTTEAKPFRGQFLKLFKTLTARELSSVKILALRLDFLTLIKTVMFVL